MVCKESALWRRGVATHAGEAIGSFAHPPWRRSPQSDQTTKLAAAPFRALAKCWQTDCGERVIQLAHIEAASAAFSAKWY